MANVLEFTLVASQTASGSFTTQFASLNYELFGIHVVYGGMADETGSIQVRVSNDPVARSSPSSAKWSSLTPTVTSLISSCDNRFFRIADLKAAYTQLIYRANSNTTGSIAAYVVEG